MSARLGADLHALLDKRGRIMRYLSCSGRTVAILRRARPAVVFAPNPSIVLTYLLIALKYVFRYTFVTDAHFAGVIAPGGSWLFQGALNIANRLADLVIVTNDDHKQRIEAAGGTAVICEDPLPDIERYLNPDVAAQDTKSVFFICSYDVDEPYAATFQAARILASDGYSFCATGNFRKAGIDPADWPEVDFLGYVPTDEFYTRLAASQVVIDLTTQDNCLLCGAYEAMTLEIPLVTSDMPALRNYFKAGTIFVEHSAERIADGVREAYAQRNKFKPQIKTWKEWACTDNSGKIRGIRDRIEK